MEDINNLCHIKQFCVKSFFLNKTESKTVEEKGKVINK